MPENEIPPALRGDLYFLRSPIANPAFLSRRAATYRMIPGRDHISKPPRIVAEVISNCAATRAISRARVSAHRSPPSRREATYRMIPGRDHISKPPRIVAEIISNCAATRAISRARVSAHPPPSSFYTKTPRPFCHYCRYTQNVLLQDIVLIEILYNSKSKVVPYAFLTEQYTRCKGDAL